MEIKEAIQKSYNNAKEHGFWDIKVIDRMFVEEKLLLMHSEITEAFEELRSHGIDAVSIYYGDKGKPEGFAIEIADLAIRIFDLCGGLGIPLEHMINTKHEYNLSRPKKHGKLC